MATETKKAGVATKAAPVVPKAETTEKFVTKEIDQNQMITVRNGFRGVLVYESARTHEVYKWEAFGDEQPIELRELRNAKSSAKGFFTNNWFMFDGADQWVLEYLGVQQFYQNALSVDNFDKLFSGTSASIEKAVAGLPDGQKAAVAFRAKQLIDEGKFDSYKTISALEKALGIQLIEK